VRTLRPLRRLRGSTVSVAQAAARLARSLFWMVTARNRSHRELPVRLTVPGLADDLALPRPGSRLAVMERSPALFRYLLDCPIVPMSLYCVAEDAHVGGYFLLALAPGQARIVDYWVDSGDPADWRSLLQSAVSVARAHPEIAEVVTIASDAMLCACLEDSGFTRRTAIDVRLRARHPVLTEDVALRLHMVDNDSAYFDAGEYQYWW